MCVCVRVLVAGVFRMVFTCAIIAACAIVSSLGQKGIEHKSFVFEPFFATPSRPSYTYP